MLVRKALFRLSHFPRLRTGLDWKKEKKSKEKQSKTYNVNLTSYKQVTTALPVSRSTAQAQRAGKEGLLVLGALGAC